MTIAALAKQLNVSTMTIYRRCDKKGLKIKNLRDDKTGELTAEGVAAIASLFDATAPQNAITEDTTRTPQGANSVTQPAQQGPGPGLVDVLQAKLDGLNALLEQVTAERDALRGQVAALTAALEREQADRASERRLLTGSGDDAGTSRRRWWPWGKR